MPSRAKHQTTKVLAPKDFQKKLQPTNFERQNVTKKDLQDNTRITTPKKNYTPQYNHLRLMKHN